MLDLRAQVLPGPGGVRVTALEELEGFRADRPARRSRAKMPWAPLTPDRLRPGVVLAFDQTIRSAGWCLLVNDQLGPRVVRAGTCKTSSSGQRGWASTLDDAEDVSRQIEAVVGMADEWVANAWRSPLGRLEVVHEAPPAGGGKLVRPESSALAALGVRMAAGRTGIAVVMLANQSVKRLLVDVGDREGQTKLGEVTKPVVGEALAALGWLAGREQLRNEHQRDAAGLGLLRLTMGVG